MNTLPQPSDSLTQRFNTIISFVTITTIALIPIHTKIASAALVFMTLFMLTQCFFSLKNHKTLKASYLIEKNKSMFLFERVVMIWLIANIIGYGLKLLIQLHHDEFNDASSFNSRNLIIALIIYLGLVKFRSKQNLYILMKYLPYALFVLGISAFLMGFILWGKLSFGTNQIPWAAGITIVSLSIHIMMFQNIKSKWIQIFGWINSLLILIAILHIGVRGSYFYALWLGILLVGLSYIALNKKNHLKSLYITSFVLCTSILIFWIFGQSIIENGINKIDRAIDEINKFSELGAAGADTSVGARLYMWTESLQLIKTKFWLGYGKAGTVDIINSLGISANSETIKGLNQVHNEYLQALLSYGVFGLVSLLIYPLSLVYIAWRVKNYNPSISFCLIGAVLLFLTSGLTNTNTYHNYFSTTFAIAIGLIMILYLRSIFSKELNV